MEIKSCLSSSNCKKLFSNQTSRHPAPSTLQQLNPVYHRARFITNDSFCPQYCSLYGWTSSFKSNNYSTRSSNYKTVAPLQNWFQALCTFFFKWHELPLKVEPCVSLWDFKALLSCVLRSLLEKRS